LLLNVHCLLLSPIKVAPKCQASLSNLGPFVDNIRADINEAAQLGERPHIIFLHLTGNRLYQVHRRVKYWGKHFKNISKNGKQPIPKSNWK